MKPTDQHLGCSLKQCSFRIAKDVQLTHIPHNNVVPFPSHAPSNSQHEIFLKTLAFHCALLEHGCLFAIESSSDKLVDTTASTPKSGDHNMDLEASEVATAALYDILCDMWADEPASSQYKEYLVFLCDIYHWPFIQRLQFLHYLVKDCCLKIYRQV